LISVPSRIVAAGLVCYRHDNVFAADLVGSRGDGGNRGAVALSVTRRIGASPMMAAFAGGVCHFVLREVAATLHWNLPKIANP